MEFGDIVYLILIIAFMFFGFFKEFRKKNRRTDAHTEPENRDSRDLFDEIFGTDDQHQTPPPVPAVKKQRPPEKEKTMRSKAYVFQSSMDLVTDFEGESSLKGYKFKDHLKKDESADHRTAATAHSLLNELTGANRRRELKKAIIYSELLKRKY